MAVLSHVFVFPGKHRHGKDDCFRIGERPLYPTQEARREIRDLGIKKASDDRPDSHEKREAN
jgi:hypothetical protein